MKRFQIHNLRQAEISVAATAASSGVSKRTVIRVGQEAPISDPTAHDEATRQRMGRPSPLTEHLPTIERWLEQDPRQSTGAILERLRVEENFQGGKSSVYTAVKRLRPAKPKDGVVRFDAVPGEFSQHDFGQVVVNFQDGTSERLHFFASTLKYSRMRRIFLVDNERVEAVCRGLVDAFEYFGGVPLVASFDNPKTIVIRHKDANVEWNKTFAHFTVEAGFSPHACWPLRPQEKGQVENLVGYSKSSFFKVHRFVDRADLEAKLAAWHVRVNEEQKSRATGEIPSVRMLLESERLRPLGIDPRGFALRYSRVVRTDGYVESGGLRYFAGFSAVGSVVNIFVSAKHVSIELPSSQGRVTHPRTPKNGKYSILPEQRQEVLQKRGARAYMKRQLVMDLCPAAEWMLTELRHRRQDQWKTDVDELYQLLEHYGEERLKVAMVEASRRNVVGPEYVEAILTGQATETEEVQA